VWKDQGKNLIQNIHLFAFDPAVQKNSDGSFESLSEIKIAENLPYRNSPATFLQPKKTLSFKV
jgi:hypothetical protein